MDSSFSSPTTKPLYRGTQIVWYILDLKDGVVAASVMTGKAKLNTKEKTNKTKVITKPTLNLCLNVLM